MKKTLVLAGLLLASLAPLSSMAEEMRGEHPAYVHALSDLRAARWLIAHRAGDAVVADDEAQAIARIDESIQEIKHAAIDDGKDINDHPDVDAKLERKGRLHKAIELLKKVRKDLEQPEDNSSMRELQKRSLHHVDEAIKATHHVIVDLKMDN
jgi:hypothetical protein